MDKIYLLKRLGIYDFARDFKYRLSRSEKQLFFSQFVSKETLCFDVGANVGSRSEIFLRLGAKVISIEPQAHCVQKLRKFKKYSESIIIIPKAVSDSIGTSRIALASFDGYSSMSEKWISTVKQTGRFRKSISWEKWQDVETTTLDALISEYGLPNYIKVDVEGFEPSVFRGLHSAINYLSFEFNWPECIEETFSVIDIIDELGKYEYNYIIENSIKWQLSEWLSAEKLKDCFSLQMKKNLLLAGEVYARLC